MAGRYQMPATIRGYEFAEVASALQKCVRRGQEEQALYWSAELDRSGYGRYLWYRLQIIACEDVGLAEGPQLFAEIRALYEAWKEVLAKKHGHKPERLFLGQAILRLVRAKKTELVGEALSCHWEINDKLFEIPDYALDPHTERGRKMGREMPDFWDITYHLENEGDVNNPYTERAKALEGKDSSKPVESETLSEKGAFSEGVVAVDADLSHHKPLDDPSIAQRNDAYWASRGAAAPPPKDSTPSML
jgi:replication-associated recombination protein RarA